jgi:hypothetical protein
MGFSPCDDGFCNLSFRRGNFASGSIRMDRVVSFVTEFVGLHIDMANFSSVILRPTGYLQWSKRRVTFKPMAVFVRQSAALIAL